MTTPQYPPAWQPPTGPDQPQYPPAGRPGAATPGGYPPPPYPGGAPGEGYPPPAYPPSPGYPQQGQPYPGQPHPGQPYPGQQYPGQPHPGQQYPGQPHPGQQYPPAGQPGYPQEPPTAVMDPRSFPPSTYPPGGADPSLPSEPVPPKKSIGGRIAALLAPVLVIVLVVALKFGAAGVLKSIFDRTSAPSNPFEGTTAESYPSGEAGIVVPTAAAVDGFTEEEVAAALETVRQALVAGRLDERMLYDHDRSDLRALFSRYGAEDLDLMFDEKLGGIVATMIAPGYELTDDPIRVSGTMTFTGVVIEDIRWLEVHTVYVWVYPFTGELKQPGDHLVTLKDDLYWLFPAAEDVLPEDLGMYLDARNSSFAYNIDCDLLDQDLVALGKPRISVGGPDINPDDVMDPNSSVNLPDTC